MLRIANLAHLPTLTNSALLPANMSTSHYASRPAQTDVGAKTIRIPLDRSLPPPARPLGLVMFFLGAIILCADGFMAAYFAETIWEASIICTLSMPLAVIVTCIGRELRK